MNTVSTVKSDFAHVLHNADAKAWAEQFVLVAYLRPEFRHTLTDLELMFNLAFNAAREPVKEATEMKVAT